MPGESTALAAVYQQQSDWTAAKAVVLDHNLFQTRTESTARRKLRELIPRLSTLTHEQLQLLVSGSISEQRALLWLSVCKRNTILKDFAQMVVREKYLTLDLLIRTTDFEQFLDSQSVWRQARVGRETEQRFSGLISAVHCLHAEEHLPEDLRARLMVMMDEPRRS